MRKFALQKMDGIKGFIPFYTLKIDGVCETTNFENEVCKSSNYLAEIAMIRSAMDNCSNGKTNLPKKKFRILKTNKSKGTFYEFKSKHLRYYGFNFKGYIICFADKNDKSEQEYDIKRLIRIYDEVMANKNNIEID